MACGPATASSPCPAGGGLPGGCTDLRGHGDSDATFTSYGDEETAGDVIALLEELGGLAVVVGNSMGAGSAAIAAAECPELVSGLVLTGPFVRNPRTSPMRRLLLRVAMAPPWTAISWKSYLPKLYAGRRPADFSEYRDQVIASIRRPGYFDAEYKLMATFHQMTDESGKAVIRCFVKGAPDQLLARAAAVGTEAAGPANG